MSYYHPSSSYLEPMPYTPMSGYGPSSVGGYGPSPVGGYGYPGYNSGYSMPEYGYGYDRSYDDDYPYDDDYYGGSPYYRQRRHSYHVCILTTIDVPSGLKNCNDDRADIATIAATHMVRECSTNTRPSEIGLWVLWACLSHIYIGFEEPKVVRSGLYPILRCVYHYSLYTLMALAVAGRLAGAAQILGSTAISDDCIVHICHLVTYLCHYTT
jgi:hypothetical protein